MNLSEEIRAKALAHAKEDAPRESVGLVCVVKGRNRYFPCRNMAEASEEQFVLDPDDYISCSEKGEIIAVIHSHPNSNHAPSQADRVACEKSGHPWFIVNPITELWGYCEPEGFELEYIGREFNHGVVDCYTLVRDYYKREFDIELTDYHRDDKWWEKGQNLYVDNFEKEGFKEIPQESLEPGDLIFMNLEAEVANHAAIYLGDMVLLHHVHGRLSSRDVYGGYYHKTTAKCLRHESR